MDTKKISQTERFESIRDEVTARVDLTGAHAIGTGEYAIETANGWAKVKITAVRAKDYDVEEAVAAYTFQLQERAQREADRAEAKAAKEAERAAKAKAKADAEA